MERFAAVSAAEGLAWGPVYRLRHGRAALARAVRDPQQEEAAFLAAVAQAKEQLSQLAQKAPEEEKDIFLAQQLMVEDPALQQETLLYIRVGAGAAAAVERAAGIFAGRLRALDDDYLRERACDVLDACSRVVAVLDGKENTPLQLDTPSILVAEELYPTDILTVNRSLLLGIVMGAGAANSHTAMIARTMGIPAVVMAGQLFLSQCEGKQLALNGSTGELWLEPDEATKARFAHILHQVRRHALSEQRLREAPCITEDGTRIDLYANSSALTDVAQAVAGGAQGIGWMPSEYVLAQAVGESEEEQVRLYSACLEAAEGRPVTISTYRAGIADAATGANQALGLSGIRYSLANPEKFEMQLAALLRAGLAGNLRIVLPMVGAREDLEQALQAVQRAKAALRKRKVPFAENVPIGVLVETPAAALLAHDLAQYAAFFHIGIANLAQYTHALDRSDPQMQEYFPTVSPAVHRLARMVMEAAGEAHIPVCVCFEGGATPQLAEIYVRLGARALSMDMGSMSSVKEHLLELVL